MNDYSVQPKARLEFDELLWHTQKAINCFGFSCELTVNLYTKNNFNMAKFLNTSATNYYLEELIKDASDRLILISPFLKLNDRIKELLEDKNRLKIDVRIVYGKSELQPNEIKWLNELTFIRTSYCKNLHAKCYMNESSCIITSLNLYEFSQVNNNEMGVHISRDDDAELYKETYEEAQRIIRISDEIKISLKKTSKQTKQDNPTKLNLQNENDEPEKLSTSKLAAKLKLKTSELFEILIIGGYVEKIDDKHILTNAGIASGGEAKENRYKKYIVWPENFDPTKNSVK